MTNEQKSYVGHDMTNQDGDSIGKITDVLYDDDDNEPKWLVVKPGLLQSERYVPIERSYETADGHIVVPFDKKWIQAAPKAGDHVMTAQVAGEAAGHYDLQT